MRTEALIRAWPRFGEWINQNRQELRIHRRLTEAAVEWEKLNRDPSALYRGIRLAQALEWAKTNMQKLNTLESRFLESSKELHEEEIAAKEAQQQRELAQAQRLAKETEARRQAEAQRAEEAEARRQAEAQRAEEAEAREKEQSKANRRLQKRHRMITFLFLIAIVVGAYASYQQIQAQFLFDQLCEKHRIMIEDFNVPVEQDENCE